MADLELTRAPPAEAAGAVGRDVIVGVEHEFHLRRAGATINFRELIDSLPLDGRRIDPTDPRAYRLASGHVITCDDAEAEYAIAPVAARPGFADRVDRSCRAVGAELRGALPDAVGVEGASTHVSVSCPDLLAPRVCSMIAQHFAPAIMLMADDDESPGMLVRPRHGRVEIGVDYVSDDALRATVAMTVGAVLACLDVVQHRQSAVMLPPRLTVRTTAARERYGLYVSRRAFPADLYYAGRSTRLWLAQGGKMPAGPHLEHAWKCARAALDPVAGPDDLTVVDDLVAGLRPLPVEVGRSRKMSTAPEPVDNDFAGLMAPHRGRSFVVAPVLLSWELGVFVLAGTRRAYAAVPRADLPAFAADLRAGRLDGTIDAFLGSPDRGRAVPPFPAAVAAARLYDHLGSRVGLQTPERGADGRPALGDGSALPRAAVAVPAGPGVWAAAASAPPPAAGGIGASAATAATIGVAAAAGIRHGKPPLPPGSVEESGSAEEGPPAEEPSWFGRLVEWLRRTSTTARVAVGVGLAVAVGLTALALSSGGSSSETDDPGTAVEDDPGTVVEEDPGSAVEEDPGTAVEEDPVTAVEDDPGTAVEETPQTDLDDPIGLVTVTGTTIWSDPNGDLHVELSFANPWPPETPIGAATWNMSVQAGLSTGTGDNGASTRWSLVAGQTRGESYVSGTQPDARDATMWVTPAGTLVMRLSGPSATGGLAASDLTSAAVFGWNSQVIFEEGGEIQRWSDSFPVGEVETSDEPFPLASWFAVTTDFGPVTLTIPGG